MAKFDYKKWVTENKHGKLNEQAGSATVQIKNCNSSSTTTLCLPNASNYSIGHQFKHQTAQGVKTGFLQSVTQQGCSAGQGGFYSNINIIEDPYVGACANNNITPDIPDTGGPTPTGSVDTETMCVGCEMVPNTNGLTLPGSTYAPQFVASGEVSTVAYSSLGFQVNGGNGPSPSGYCGGNEPFSPFSVVGSNDFANNITSICAASASMYDSPEEPIEEEIMCVGCEMVPNTNGLTLPSYNGGTYTPQFVASGEVATIPYSSLDYQVNGGNGPLSTGYCGAMEFSPFSVVGSNDFADNVTSICASSGSMYGSPEPIEEPTGSFGTTGNYTVFDYPSGWEVTQWTVEFVEMVLDHPNPCNFLQGRINNFSNKLQGDIGPLQQNLLMQKLAVCEELLILTGCNNLQEQSKKYKLDPKAVDVLKKMTSRLKGLSSKGKRIKRRNEDQISKLKNIIRETILELQEIENVSGQSCYYTNSGGAEENQDPNYCAQAGQPCTSGSDTERCICDCTGGSNPGVLRKPSKGIKRAPKRVAISNPTRGIRGKRLKK